MNKMRLKLTLYNKDSFLEFVKKNNISITHLISEEDNLIFCCSFFAYLKIKKVYKEVVVIKENISFKVKKHLKNNIIVILSIMCSLIVLYDNSRRIKRIEINGVSSIINGKIVSQLEEYNIKKNCSKISSNDLKRIEKEIYSNLSDEIYLLSFVMDGNILVVTYQKRAKPITLEPTKGKMYAKSDGVIKEISISSGNVLVRVNQYVKKGDLLVDDTIVRNDINYNVGTKGKILGYTFYSLSFTKNKIDNDMLIEFLLDGRNKIGKNLKEDEYIYSEKVIYQSDNRITIHYTCVENLITF